VGRLRERERELAAVEVLLERHGQVLLFEGRAGIGKTSLAEAACARAGELGHEVVHARGSQLESGFAFGVVRQLFERRLAGAAAGEREALLAGPAAAARPLLSGEPAAQPSGDSSFAVLHGLYWAAGPADPGGARRQRRRPAGGGPAGRAHRRIPRPDRARSQTPNRRRTQIGSCRPQIQRVVMARQLLA
jgi:hypothetical protein